MLDSTGGFTTNEYLALVDQYKTYVSGLESALEEAEAALEAAQESITVEITDGTGTVDSILSGEYSAKVYGLDGHDTASATVNVENETITITLTESQIASIFTHNYEVTSTTDAGCETEGSVLYTCSVCGVTKTETISATGHTLTHVAEVSATCESIGIEEYWICSVCNKMFSDEAGTTVIDAPVVIKATGHDWDYSNIIWTWEETGDGYSATATVSCKNDSDHTKSTTADVVSESIAPSCEDAGSTTYTASITVDGVTYSDVKKVESEATGHSLSYIEQKDATCEEAGYKAYWICSVCNKMFSNAEGTTEISAPAEISAIGHNWDFNNITWTWVETENGYSVTATVSCENDNDHICTLEAEVRSVTSEAACTEGGTKTYTAVITYGGETYSDEKVVVIDALGHQLKKTDQVDATCETAGTEAYWTCSVCEKMFSDSDALTEITEPVSIPALSHDWDEGSVTTEATCEEDGVLTYTCKNDSSHTYTETIAATGHSISYVDKQEATCEEDGYEAYWTCENCGKIFSDETGTTELDSITIITAIGHAYEVTETIDATCTTDGSVTYVCSNDSSHTYIETIDALGHTWGEWETVEAAACEESGYQQRTCSVCGTVETEDLDATGHTWEDDYTVDVEPTCTTDGSKSIHCSVCGAKKDSVTIPATGHSYGDGVVTVEAACTEAGEMTYTCTICGDTYTEVIAATGHSYDDGVVTTAATCKGNGLMTYTCTVCGETYTEVIAATGHTWDDGVVTVEATEEEDGEMTYTCTVCGATYTEVIAATGTSDEDDSDSDGSDGTDDADAEDNDTELTIQDSTSDSTAAQTGDAAHAALWLGILLVAALGIHGARSRRKAR